MILPILCALPAAAADWLPATCEALQTVGMHRYPGDADEAYAPAVFTEQTFDLRENVLFMRHLSGGRGGTDSADPDGPAQKTTRLYITMTAADGTETEFECGPVRGTGGNAGYSCVNSPPSEMLLINPARARFTRSAIGGWAFYAPEASLFVEYGTCVREAPGRAAGEAEGGARVEPTAPDGALAAPARNPAAQAQ